MTIAIIKTVSGGLPVIRTAENTGEAARQAGLSASKAVEAAESASFAEEFSGPAYASQAAGEAATTTGQFFRVPIGTTPETYTRYQRSSGGSVEAAALATTSFLGSVTGAQSIGVNQGGTDAIDSTVEAELRRFVWVGQYGAVGDGVADDAAAIIKAITAHPGAVVQFGQGEFLIGSTLGTLPEGTTLRGLGRRASSIVKGFNGDIGTMDLDSQIEHLKLDGDGSNYTGRGIVITAGSSSGTGYQKIRNCAIVDMASYCVEWTTNSAGWGGGMYNCDVQRTGNTGDCLKMPDTETNGNRELASVFAGSGPLIDFAGAANVQMSNCSSGSAAGASRAFQMLKTSAKIQITNCRFAVGGGSTSLLGQNHIFKGNSHPGPFSYGNGTSDSLVNSVAKGNDFAGAVVTYDPNTAQANSNQVDIRRTAFSAAWTAGGSAPAIGNGSINGSYSRNGDIVTLSIDFTAGSTTTFGTGAWSFALPIKAASRVSVGSASMIDLSAGAHFLGAVRANADATTLQVYPQQANILQNNSPFAWATGDGMALTISYFAI